MWRFVTIARVIAGRLDREVLAGHPDDAVAEGGHGSVADGALFVCAPRFSHQAAITCRAGASGQHGRAKNIPRQAAGGRCSPQRAPGKNAGPKRRRENTKATFNFVFSAYTACAVHAVPAEALGWQAAALKEARALVELPALASRDAVAVSASSLRNTFITQPQQTNMHGRIFGGFLMRRGYELAFATTYAFAGVRPTFVKVDEVVFVKPVDVGDLLRLESKVTSTRAATRALTLTRLSAWPCMLQGLVPAVVVATKLPACLTQPP
eukprot:357951-Chlamydomonas_euryale.AAC.5